MEKENLFNKISKEDALRVARADANVGILHAIDTLEELGYDCSYYFNRMAGVKDVDEDNFNIRTRDSLFKKLGIKGAMDWAYDQVWDKPNKEQPKVEELKEEEKEPLGKVVKKIKLPHEEYTKYEDLVRINDELGEKARAGKLVPLRKEDDKLMLAEPAINGIWTYYLDKDGNIIKITLW